VRSWHIDVLALVSLVLLFCGLWWVFPPVALTIFGAGGLWLAWLLLPTKEDGNGDE
jgi:hypothetical protein